MTPLFWMAVTWALCATGVSRLPAQQRPLPGALLLLAALPILLMIVMQMGFLAGIFAIIAILSMFPNPVRMAVAYWRGERFRIDANVLRYLAAPGEL